MSEVKVNKISPRTACGTVTLGDSGDTFTIPAGATISNAGTAAGFGSTGEVSWNTTKITSDPSTAATGVGYFTDTSGGAFNVTLPASPSAGNVVAVADYANTWDTNALTILRNGSNIEGAASNFQCNQEGSSITFVYVDATKGWVMTNSGNSSQAFVNPYVIGTGGTIVDIGDFRYHKFTGPGTFTVTDAGTPTGSTTLTYLVVGGGGTGGNRRAGGGGAGGLRIKTCETAVAQGYPVTVGGGGASVAGPDTGGDLAGNPGNNSIFSSTTSNGGGGGGQACGVGSNGASGGGGGSVFPTGSKAAGTGNTPPTSPAQGTNGGTTPSGPAFYGSSGGGATGAGASNCTGGTGATSSITNSSVNRAGGGGGRSTAVPAGVPYGGGRFTSPTNPGSNGTVNTGGGAGSGGAGAPGCSGGAGGSGIVVIRYKFQN